MAEAGIRRTQGLLPQDATLRMHQRERGVVADRADVSEMIGEALELGHQRAQIDRARRHLDRERRFDRPCKGDGIGHRAVTGSVSGKMRGLFELRARHQPLDSLVHIAQALLEPHHGLAIGGEAKMAWLDDAGMHRPDRDLVQPLALGRQKGIGRGCAAALWRLPERVRDVPETEVQPRTRVRQADRLKAVKVT